MTALTDRLNTALAGRYAIVRHLGDGGMASVYLCEDLKNKRRVALKLLKPEIAAVLGAERFVQEIKTTASLQHPHILPLFNSGEADSYLYYVMPYVEGESLRARLFREKQLSVEESVRIAREVLGALGYAHRHGVIHRDIKPENILLHDGSALVADFGIALAVTAAARGRMTQTGLSIGTPQYMSPEQATAEKEITGRADLYSLGSVLYEMLAGQPPHTGASAQQILMRIIAEPVLPVTSLRKEVPENVAASLATALEKLPADRFQSAEAFSDALRNPAYTHVSGEVLSSPDGFAAVMTRRLKRALIGTTVLAAAAIGTTLWLALRTGPAPVVSRGRIVLWGTPRIPAGRVSRGLAISPDGETIVFVDSSTAGSQLYAKGRDRLASVPLIGSAGIVGGPTFSPDGAWIAFMTSDGKVKKVPKQGGIAITIADSANAREDAAVAWLEGGTVLYADVKGVLRAVDQWGGVSRQLYDPDRRDRRIVSLAALPGGQAALVGTCSAGCAVAELRVLSLGSREVKVLAPGAIAGWPLQGGVVAFVQLDGRILAGPFDKRSATFRRPPIPVLDGIRVDYYADVAVSPGGASLIYVPGTASAAGRNTVLPVWVTRAGLASEIDAAWTFPVQHTGGDRMISVSRDGRRIALSEARSYDLSEREEIWIKRLDRAPDTRLTLDGININPVWTLDERALLYACGAGKYLSRVCRRRADGAGAADTVLRLASRSIDGVLPTRDTARYILRLGVPPSRDIVLGAWGDTGTTTLVAVPTVDEISPALSPNGRWLAYASDESGRFEVYVRPYPDVNAARWQLSQAGGSSPVWARSGRELFYRNGANELVATTVGGSGTFALGAQKVLFNVSKYYGDNLALYYDVAPDDQRFVFMASLPFAPPGPRPSAPVVPNELIEVTNWAMEVQAKLAGRAPR